MPHWWYGLIKEFIVCLEVPCISDILCCLDLQYSSSSIPVISSLIIQIKTPFESSGWVFFPTLLLCCKNSWAAWSLRLWASQINICLVFCFLIARNTCETCEHFFFFPKKRGLCRDAIVCMCIHTYVLIHTYTWCNNKPYLWHLLGTTRTASMGLYDFSLKYKYSNCNLQYVTVFKNDFYSERTFTLFYWIYSSVVEILQNREKSWFFNYIFYLLIFWNWEAVKLFFF